MVILITFAFCEKEGVLGIMDLELISVSTNDVTGLDTRKEISNKSIISDILIFDEKDELALLKNLLMLPLRACPNCGFIKLVLDPKTFANDDIYLVILNSCGLSDMIDGIVLTLECHDPRNNKN